MTVLIVHGICGLAGIHWQQWLYNELVKRGFRVIMPELPDADHPERAKWLKVAFKSVERVGPEDLVIVGHSLGVVTALDLIQASRKPVKALISVSGFSEDYGAKLNSYFLKEKQVDFDRVNQNLKKAFVLYGDDDPFVPQKILKSLADKLQVKPKVFPCGGHLNTKTGYNTFPELLRLFESLRK